MGHYALNRERPVWGFLRFVGWLHLSAAAHCSVSSWFVGLVENDGFRHHISGILANLCYFMGNWDGM